jgi:hypothetical protein
MSDKEYKFNPGRFGQKLHALFEGTFKEDEWKDEEKEETLPATTTDEPPKDVSDEKGEKESDEVEEKEHKSVDALADAATKVQDAVSVIKASEELEHDGTITKDEHEKIEAKAVEKLDTAKEELNKAGEDFKAAEKEEGNPGIKPDANTPPAVPEENKVEKPQEIEEKKSPKSFKQYMS